MSSSLPPGINLCEIPALQPPPGHVSNFVNPTTLAPVTWAICLILTICSISLVALRLWMNIRKLDMADCMLVCYCEVISMTDWDRFYGYGRSHDNNLHRAYHIA